MIQKIIQKFSSRIAIIIVDGILFLFAVLGVHHVTQKAALNIPLLENQHAVLVSEALYPFNKGDRIVSLNGYAIHHQEEIEFILDGLHIRDTVALVAERKGERLQQQSVLVPYYTLQYVIILVLSASVFFGVGIFVFLKKPRDDAAIVLHWGLVSVALIITTTWGSLTITPLFFGYLLRIIFSVAYSCMPVLFVNLSLLFPSRKRIFVRSILAPMYAIAVMLSLWMSFSFIQSVHPISMEWFQYYINGFNGARIFFSLCLLVGVFNFIHSYRTSSDEVERKKLRWVIIGLAVGPLGFIFLWQLPLLLFAKALVPEEIIILISSITPITFAISIVRYRLFDVDVILNRSTVYVLVIGVLVAVYAGIVGMVASLVGAVSAFSSPGISVFAAIVVALLFEPAKKRVQHFVDKKFFRVQYDYRLVQKNLIEEIKNCVGLQELAELVASRVETIFSLHQCLIMIHENIISSKKIIVKHGSIISATEELLARIPKRSSEALPFGRELSLETGVPFDASFADTLLAHRLCVVLVVQSEMNEVFGYLCIGEKKSGTRFTIEDIDLLNTIAVQTGFAIQRIILYQKLVLKNAEAQRLDELNRMKSYFVSSVSHDLKTPLTSIRMFAELLQSKKNIAAARRKEYLGIIQGESERLTRLIDNVLDFAKIERGVQEYHFEHIELHALITETVHALQYQLQMEHCIIQKKFAKKKMYLHADPDAVKEALINLISNALKYSTDKKHIVVSTFKKNKCALLQVRDYGNGISTNDLENVFEPFFRAKDSHAHTVGGTGLGLSLVKHIMDAHQGTIEVTSKVGKGSTFTLFFPVKLR